MPECVMEGECKPIQLEPFVHQVGGHSSMLKFDESTVCKPLISREHLFYETLPIEMKDFTPQYRGVVEVSFHEDSKGYVTLVAYPPDYKKKNKRSLSPGSSPSSSGEGVQSDSDSENPTSSRTRQRFRLRRSGSIEVVGGREKMFETAESQARAGHNPWSLRCHKEQVAKMRMNSKGTNSHKFILLENLASHFHLPCILDLKMGTRQHGDDASDEKRQNQIRKCASTTSSSLGIRICGMQVYHASSGRYVCHNKYYGRRLAEEGVHDTLCEFLNNGRELRTDLIDQIVERLRRLYTMVAKQNTFRFYSSSLLIMYEGADPSFSAEEDTQGSPQPDLDQASDIGAHAGPSQGAEWAHRQRDKPFLLDSSPGLDVRMIDFAHATHQGFRGDRTVHTGPDRGYLFGLENLIRMFEMIKSRAS